MSKALWSILAQLAPPLSQPASAAARGQEPLSPLMFHLLGLGLVALAGWLIIRLARPEKFTLRRSPGRVNQLNPLHLLAVFAGHVLVLAVGGLLVEVRLGLAKLDPNDVQTMKWLLPVQMAAQATLIGLSLGAAWLTFQGGLRRGLGLSPHRWPLDAFRSAVAALAVLPLVWVALVAGTAFVQWLVEAGLLKEMPLKHPLLTFAAQAGPGWAAVAIVAAIVLAPLGEELFFRGLLQSMFRRYFGRPWLGIVSASILFALAHQGQFQDWPALAVLGIVLGYNYERTGRLTAPILTHALFNAMMLAAELEQAGATR